MNVDDKPSAATHAAPGGKADTIWVLQEWQEYKSNRVDHFLRMR
jgi:hypothetical protein